MRAAYVMYCIINSYHTCKTVLWLVGLIWYSGLKCLSQYNHEHIPTHILTHTTSDATLLYKCTHKIKWHTLSWASMTAPLSMRSCATGRCPSMLARMRAVLPVCWVSMDDIMKSSISSMWFVITEQKARQVILLPCMYCILLNKCLKFTGQKAVVGAYAFVCITHKNIIYVNHRSIKMRGGRFHGDGHLLRRICMHARMYADNSVTFQECNRWCSLRKIALLI